MTAPPTANRARLETNPFESKGSRGMLVGFIVGLLVIAGAYGLAVKRGMQPMAAGRNLLAMLRNWDAPPATPQFSITDTKSSTTETPATAATTTEPQVPRGLDPNNLPAVGATPVTVPEPTDVLAQAKSGGRVRSAARPAVQRAPPPQPRKTRTQTEH